MHFDGQGGARGSTHPRARETSYCGLKTSSCLHYCYYSITATAITIDLC